MLNLAYAEFGNNLTVTIHYDEEDDKFIITKWKSDDEISSTYSRYSEGVKKAVEWLSYFMSDMDLSEPTDISVGSGVEIDPRWLEEGNFFKDAMINIVGLVNKGKGSEERFNMIPSYISCFYEKYMKKHNDKAILFVNNEEGLKSFSSKEDLDGWFEDWLNGNAQPGYIYKLVEYSYGKTPNGFKIRSEFSQYQYDMWKRNNTTKWQKDYDGWQYSL